MTNYSPFLLLVILMAISCQKPSPESNQFFPNPEHFSESFGAIVRGDTTQKPLSLVFTGDEFADGADHIIHTLDSFSVRGAFFFTGNFYRNPAFQSTIKTLKEKGHYLGAHSDRHLLYCTWEDRDSLLVSRDSFLQDLDDNYLEMSQFSITKEDASIYLPPFEWYNDSISKWTNEAGFELINFTYGTRTNADYTTPSMSAYLTSDEIYQSVIEYESGSNIGLNGFIMLIHIGTDPEREDKFYHQLGSLVRWLEKKEYQIVRIDKLLGID